MDTQPICPTCNKEPAVMHHLYGITIGIKCQNRSRKNDHFRKVDGRKALTAYERMKLSWYRDEKKWHENIRNRGMVNENGRKIPVILRSDGSVKERMPGPRDRE